MANTYSTLIDLFTGIADAIRSKNGSTQAIIADNFPTEISNLRTGFDYANHDVTSIPDYAFYGCEDLNSVDCYNVTSIGASAFENCTNLKTVILYDGVESVGENAFKGCDCIIYYKGTSIPDTWNDNWNPDNCIVLCGELIKTWDISATKDDNVIAYLCNSGDKYSLYIYGHGNMRNYYYSSTPWKSYSGNIEYVVIGTGIIGIGNSAFSHCNSLTSITIPNSVTSIGKYAFYGCSSLTSITIPDSVIYIGSFAFDGCTGLTHNHYDNAYYLGNENNPYLLLFKVKNKDISSCNIHNNTKIIGNNAFNIQSNSTHYGCASLTSITIPDGVTSIGDNAFSYCTSLTSITIPNSVTSIGKYAFSSCTSLTSITIPDSVTSIGNSAFNNTAYYKDASNWEGDVLYINNHLIAAERALTDYKIKDGVITIGGDAFQYSGLTSITIPDSVTSIGNSAFYGCSSLTSITIPNSVTSIGSGAFCNCTSLTSIAIPDNVTSIGVDVFNGCDELSSVTIPGSVTSIGENAFRDCQSLTSILYTDTIKEWKRISFDNGWNYYTPDYTIHCTDGDIAKDGTITYHTTI